MTGQGQMHKYFYGETFFLGGKGTRIGNIVTEIYYIVYFGRVQRAGAMENY